MCIQLQIRLIHVVYFKSLAYLSREVCEKTHGKGGVWPLNKIEIIQHLVSQDTSMKIANCIGSVVCMGLGLFDTSWAKEEERNKCVYVI